MGRLAKRIGCVIAQTLADLKYNKKHAKNSMCKTDELEFSRLRMFCHMLDKGMNNPKFQKGHSLAVYAQAKQFVEKLQPVFGDDPAFLWAKNIVERFEKAQETGKVEQENVAPLEYGEQERAAFEAFVKSRISCRNFKDEKIPESVLEEIVKLAIDAPNGCCRQTVRYYVTQNEETINAVVPNVSGITNFSKIPCLVCVAAESSFYDLVDRNLQFVDASLSAENFILAARMHNIYGTMCNFFRADEGQRELCKKALGLRDSENIVMFIAMGYASALPEKPLRRNVETFLKICR